MDAVIDNFNTWVKGSEGAELKSNLELVLNKAGFSMLNFMEHHFEPMGYTAVWLLAESHCALHTFPEEDKSYIELASCNRRMYEGFLKEFDNHFSKL